jgi:hypothetical protein
MSDGEEAVTETNSDTFPRNLIEFLDRFDTDEACLEYLRRVRWPDGFVCPQCGARWLGDRTGYSLLWTV